MEELNKIVRQLHGRSERFSEHLAELEHAVMGAVAENDDLLQDNDVNAITLTMAVATKLFEAAHAVALGLSADSPASKHQVTEALAGLSALADQDFGGNDTDDEENQ